MTITNCNFVRCTFRDTSFSDVESLNCTFVDVDFREVAIRNSLVADTTFLKTTVNNSIFNSVSWGRNIFEVTAMSDVESRLSNWTYIVYSGVVMMNLVKSPSLEKFDRQVKFRCDLHHQTSSGVSQLQDDGLYNVGVQELTTRI